MIQITFIIEAQYVEEARRRARILHGVPADAVIDRETWGFGDYMEYPLASTEGGEVTHYFCSCMNQEPRAAEIIGFILRQGLPWAKCHYGDARPLLASMGLVLQERKPEYPAQILGIDY